MGKSEGVPRVSGTQQTVLVSAAFPVQHPLVLTVTLLSGNFSIFQREEGCRETSISDHMLYINKEERQMENLTVIVTLLPA